MYDNRPYGVPMSPPPMLPPKTSSKKKFFKGSLQAIKNALLKSTKPLRRQNSMYEGKERPKAAGLRRQHSLMERSSGYGMRSPQFTHRPAQQMYYDDSELQQRRYYGDGSMDYANPPEQIYDNYPRAQQPHAQDYYAQESLYANRALIELERKAREKDEAGEGERQWGGGRVVRRHSMADRTNRGSPMIVPRMHPMMAPHRRDVECEEVYQTRSGAFMMDANAMLRQVRPRDEEALYQSRREMHLDHLYQSKKEMQQRIHQGRVEVERAAQSESPSLPSSSTASTPVNSDPTSPLREQIYQSRRELKEKGFKTRTQLRDHIYQTRRDAMESMAEPIYVSKKRVEVQHHQESPSFEQVDHTPMGLAPATQTVTVAVEQQHSAPQEPCETTQESLDETNESLTQMLEPTIVNQNSRNSSGSDDEETLSPNQSDLQKTVVCVPPQAEAPQSQVDPHQTPLSPRADRAHLSNMIKRIAPHPPPRSADTICTTNAPSVHASRTSIETNYTSSQISLPIGPPAAQSTPYTSEMALEAERQQLLDASEIPSFNFYPPLREQSTSRGTFDENGGTLCDNVWNVSIHIPKGAIPSGVQQEIYFTVTDPRMSQTVGGPPLDMENGWCCI